MDFEAELEKFQPSLDIEQRTQNRGMNNEMSKM